MLLVLARDGAREHLLPPQHAALEQHQLPEGQGAMARSARANGHHPGRRTGWLAGSSLGDRPPQPWRPRARARAPPRRPGDPVVALLLLADIRGTPSGARNNPRDSTPGARETSL